MREQTNINSSNLVIVIVSWVEHYLSNKTNEKDFIAWINTQNARLIIRSITQPFTTNLHKPIKLPRFSLFHWFYRQYTKQNKTNNMSIKGRYEYYSRFSNTIIWNTFNMNMILFSYSQWICFLQIIFIEQIKWRNHLLLLLFQWNWVWMWLLVVLSYLYNDNPIQFDIHLMMEYFQLIIIFVFSKKQK